ncbi:MAG TPA: radical SAM protein [Syntrophales bacterium]|nr:radical SAM protein [Syntrophales bacterium]
MKYEGIIIRPPSEAYSLLLQVTVGCSHNRCTFCPTYKGVKFRIKSPEEISEDIRAARRYRQVEKVFLCDGDALIVPQARLLDMLHQLKESLPALKRVGLYGNAKSILRKSREELGELRETGLGIVYLGVESGHRDVLRDIKKGVSYDQLVEAGRRVKDAGISLSVTVILGLGGRDRSVDHARETARILTDIDPDYVGALTLMLVPGTPLHDEYDTGKFILPDTFDFLNELGIMIANSTFTNCFFTSNHASNYLPIRARLPQEKEKTVALIQKVIGAANPGLLRPEYARAL